MTWESTVITEDQASRVMKIVHLPLSQKIETINDYIKTIGLDVPLIVEEEIGDHMGKLAYIDTIYNRITKPHKLPVR